MVWVARVQLGLVVGHGVGQRGRGHQRALLAVQELRQELRGRVRGERLALRLRQPLEERHAQEHEAVLADDRLGRIDLDRPVELATPRPTGTASPSSTGCAASRCRSRSRTARRSPSASCRCREPASRGVGATGCVAIRRVPPGGSGRSCRSDPRARARGRVRRRGAPAPRSRRCRIEWRTRKAAASGSRSLRICPRLWPKAISSREALGRDPVDHAEAGAHVGVALGELEDHEEEAAVAAQLAVARLEVRSDRFARVVAEPALHVELGAVARHLAVAPSRRSAPAAARACRGSGGRACRRRCARARRRRPCRSPRSPAARTTPRRRRVHAGVSRRRALGVARARIGRPWPRAQATRRSNRMQVRVTQ